MMNKTETQNLRLGSHLMKLPYSNLTLSNILAGDIQEVKTDDTEKE